MLHWNDTPPAEAHGLEFAGAGELGKGDLHTAQAFEALWAGLTCVVNGACVRMPMLARECSP
jgi:hypothetical protein